MYKIPVFKIRCSAIGQIMAGNVAASPSQLKNIELMEFREKPMTVKQKEKYDADISARDNPELPSGAKTYCNTWFNEKFFNRREEFSSKYTDKGNICEDASIEFIKATYLIDKSIMKNETFFSDAEIMGTPDLIVSKDYIIDAKNSWTTKTFPLTKKLPDKDYWWQGQGYMALHGSRRYSVVHTLMNTPDSLIYDEARRASYKSDMHVDDIFEVLKKEMTYDDIDSKYRIKKFDFDYDAKAVEDIRIRVKMCRAYIAVLSNNLKEVK